jgi:hypothetical protein
MANTSTKLDIQLQNLHINHDEDIIVGGTTPIGDFTLVVIEGFDEMLFKTIHTSQDVDIELLSEQILMQWDNLSKEIRKLLKRDYVLVTNDGELFYVRWNITHPIFYDITAGEYKSNPAYWWVTPKYGFVMDTSKTFTNLDDAVKYALLRTGEVALNIAKIIMDREIKLITNNQE